MILRRRLLLAQPEGAGEAGWGQEIETVLSPSGVMVYRARSSHEVVQRIEEGGLSAAVLFGEQPLPGGTDIFSLLRLIRSIDMALPCWLVVRMTTRRALERALELRVQSIIEYPSGVADLIAGLRKVLQDSGRN
jgi:DNA-binding response OmpR family regulator